MINLLVGDVFDAEREEEETDVSLQNLCYQPKVCEVQQDPKGLLSK